MATIKKGKPISAPVAYDVPERIHAAVADRVHATAEAAAATKRKTAAEGEVLDWMMEQRPNAQGETSLTFEKVTDQIDMQATLVTGATINVDEDILRTVVSDDKLFDSLYKSVKVFDEDAFHDAVSTGAITKAQARRVIKELPRTPYVRYTPKPRKDGGK